MWRDISSWGWRAGEVKEAVLEMAILPQEARLIVEKSMKPIRRLLITNIEAENTAMNASSLADMAMTFFSGLSIEQNLASNRQSGLKRVEVFMQVMRALSGTTR